METTTLQSSLTAREKRVEYYRFADLERIYRLKKGFVYSLIEAGKIKSVLVCQDGKTRGVRLFPVDSIEEFFANLQGE